MLEDKGKKASTDLAALEAQLDPERVPRHVAVIMDGNGRWATDRGLPRIEGHRAGAESVRQVARAARALGVKTLTLFAFSEQNWDRPDDEVRALMDLLYRYVIEERDEIMNNGIRLKAIGDLDRLPDIVRKALYALMEVSSKNSDMVLCLALSYGGREDIAFAARSLARQAAAGEVDPETIDAETFSQHMSSSILPEVDLLIRTSGELRISNFLLWQVAYAELLFTETMWPEFRREDFVRSLLTFQDRERRYGLTSEQMGYGADRERDE